MRKDKNIEMRIYELLGVKGFKKIVLALKYIIKIPSTTGFTKKERKEFIYNTASNYNIGEVKNYETISNFKKELYKNALIHLIGVFSGCFVLIRGVGNIVGTIFMIIVTLINLYCVMLQRYNCIRINPILKKLKPRYEAEKNVMKKELKKEDELLIDHSYKIVDKKKKESNVTLDDLISNASIDQLKKYREFFQSVKEYEEYLKKYEDAVSIPIDHSKSLKIEFK